MLNFTQRLYFKIIALTVAGTLFCEATVYGADVRVGDTFRRKVSPTREEHLRVPITDGERMEKMRCAQLECELAKKKIKEEEDIFTIRIRILTGVVYFTLFNLIIEDYFRVSCSLVATIFYPILLFLFSLAKVKGHISGVEEYIRPLPPDAGSGYRESSLIKVPLDRRRWSEI